VREHRFKMPAKSAVKSEKAEDEQPKQSRSQNERYLLQIDRPSKRSFKTPEAARLAAMEIKSRFPTLQVSIYDTVSRSRTVVD